jgi:hypothetical protein
MKKMRTIAVLALAVLLVASFSFAETFRQGPDRKAFNPTRIVVKTASYTLATSDSEVQFNASTDVTATLPAISSSAYPGTKTYKIKQLSGSGRVIISPATGSTIGGETQRVITYKNGYVVISAGPNSDWSVDFESAITLEDYKYGSANTFAAQTVTASTTFTAGDCGKTIAVGTDSLTMTLPTAFAGCGFTFINSGAAGNNILDVAAASTDAFYGTLWNPSTTVGTIVTSATGSTLSNTKTTAKKGDTVSIYSTGAAAWIITRSTGTWTTK